MPDLKTVADAYWDLYKRTDEARGALVGAILEALDSGMSQAEVSRQSGYPRERIRLITKNRGE